MELAMLAEASPGGRVQHELQMVGRSLKVFLGNAGQLYATLQHFQDPDTWMKPPDPALTGWEEIDEIDRLMHNFLASSFTLTEITLKARKAVASDDFDQVYAEHSPFADPICVIMKLVRHDVQHAHLAGVEVYIQAPAVPNPEPGAFGLERRFFLVRKYLMALKLNAATKKYVQEHGDLPLDEIVDTYAQFVIDFANWFAKALSEHMAEELVLTTAMRARAQELVLWP
jgi:hypothetical protein